jgi:hypothetical protein
MKPCKHLDYDIETWVAYEYNSDTGRFRMLGRHGEVWLEGQCELRDLDHIEKLVRLLETNLSSSDMKMACLLLWKIRRP